MWASLPLLDAQPSISGAMGSSTLLYDEVSNREICERPRDPRKKNQGQAIGAPPEKVQVRNAGTIFVTVALGNDVMLVRPNQTRPWAIVTAAGNVLTL